MVSGLWANSNYDDEKNTRDGLLQKVEDFYTSSVASIYGKKEDARQFDQDDPFFAAMKRPEALKLEVTSESAGELNERPRN
jgi:hypothetical protein